MLRKVIQVKPNSDFTVFVYFSDGKIKLFDMSRFIGQSAFKQVSDIESFLNKCTVMNGTLAWDLSGQFDPYTCVDIDPETLYSEGIDVSVDPIAQEDTAS